MMRYWVEFFRRDQPRMAWIVTVRLRGGVRGEGRADNIPGALSIADYLLAKHAGAGTVPGDSILSSWKGQEAEVTQALSTCEVKSTILASRVGVKVVKHPEEGRDHERRN